MNRTISLTKWPVVALVALVVFFAPQTLKAHCDGLDGPVVTAARKALETGNVNLVLIWVQKDDEAAIKRAFEETLAVRKLSPEAQELADRYFFETLVRVHRAGEGAPYTGLKPAGRDLGPAIPAVDQAVSDGSLDPVLDLILVAVENGFRDQFKHVMSCKNFATNDVEAGREYVKAYVVFGHYVKGIYDATMGSAEGHFPETTKIGMHQQ